MSNLEELQESIMGPSFSYADELATPSEMGIGRDGSFNGIMRAASGVNYYVDSIGFGQATGLAKLNGMDQKPLGIKYFLKTGQICSNGADMYEYIDTVPKGLPGRVGNEIKKTMGVDFRGLAPGIIEDSASALNPLPLFKSVIGSGYARCKKERLPVGDTNNSVKSRHVVDGKQQTWIKDPVEMVNGVPHQTRWVFDQYISVDEYEKTPDTEMPGKNLVREEDVNIEEEIKKLIPVNPFKKEGFTDVNRENKIAAGVLFAALFLGMVAWTSNK
jgi:hypothetical protein